MLKSFIYLFLQSLRLFIQLLLFFFFVVIIITIQLFLICEPIFFIFIDAIWSAVFLVLGCLLLIGALQLLIDQLLLNLVFLLSFCVVLGLVITLN